MKVIVVNKMYPYEGGWVLGVFSSLEKANEGIIQDKEKDKEKKWAPKCEYDVEEWDVDGQMTNDFSAP